MSNQRARKSYSASAMNGDGMRNVLFFKDAKIALEEAGYDDAAFYFEQVEDHLRTGGSLPTNQREIERILGLWII